MLKAYLITYKGKPLKVYRTNGGAKRALAHLVRYRSDEEKKLYQVVELNSVDTSLVEIAERNGMKRTGNAVAPVLLANRGTTDLIDVLTEVQRTRKIVPMQQKIINDKLAQVLLGVIQTMVELGIPTQQLINYAGGKLS